MAFDDPTRGRLQRFVNDARELLKKEFTRQLQHDYGLDPASGTITPLESLRDLNDAQRETARILRDTLAHYCASGEADPITGLDRIVREQAFTLLNRLAALRMAETRGLLTESVRNGYQAKGFQLYLRLAGTGLGEMGDAYRVYLLSVFDELAQDLPGLFDRFSPQGRLFPRETALLPLLALINDVEIEHLWAEDETIGWTYQYFNSREERKAMRKASEAPRNSRELAVRNQFFTPRYVVEFLVDNTLGRLWFNATGGQTRLRERCQYLLVKPDEQPKAATSVRDPRTLKLLDPACGSMHFGLYAFDLFSEIYLEAWDWEQEHGAGSLDVSTQAPAGFEALSEAYEDKAAFLLDIPRLILEHNIYGVDIDPRAAQIASVALWLRAQRAWHEAEVKAKDRPVTGRGHVVAATAPPGEEDLSKQFAAQLHWLDAELFKETLQLLSGLPELGVLLQVEQELPSLIREVFGEHGEMFKEADVEQWRKAELRLREALTDFSQAAKSTYRGRLFAQDALQGLRLIDLCGEVFDVIVMNPPFGAISKGAQNYLGGAYPNSNNDLLGVFVDRGLDLLRVGGRLGAITSRTCFFLSSFANWREHVVLERASIDVIVDLGQGVMDDAMVEAAAYVLERGARSKSTSVIRTISEENREEALNAGVAAVRVGSGDHHLHSGHRETFNLLPDKPFVYWVSTNVVRKFLAAKTFDPSVGSVRQGLSTSDNFRFVRAVWETPYEDTILCYYPTDGSNVCNFDDPIVAAYLRRRSRGIPRWAFYVMAGASQPWYAPVTVKVNFLHDGRELKNFRTAGGKPRGVVRNKGFYYRPGFSWTLRAVRFYPYVIPGNCIPSASRYMAFPERGKEIDALAVCGSRLASAFLRFYAEFWQRPKYLVENVKMLPSPKLSSDVHEYLKALIEGQVKIRRLAYQNFEPFHEFVVPARIRDYTDGGKALEFDPMTLLGEDGEGFVADAYGLTAEQAVEIEKDLKEAITYQQRGATSRFEEEEEDDDEDTLLDTSRRANEDALISYLIGCVFGRWDIRIATGQSPAPCLGDVFSPLPVCPPGMLQNSCGLPANEDDRPADYPISCCWSGILVDDEGHPFDIVENGRAVLRAILGPGTDSAEESACAELGVKSLREYLSRPSGFFANHLRRYSKSSRKAPIYWALGTSSNRYTLWIYYPRLGSQTLYTAINDFLEPKIKDVGIEIGALRSRGSQRSRDDEESLESLQSFEEELMELRDILLKLAPNYNPNHDDGIQINAAPMWPLFRHKPWQKVLKETWTKLGKGEYDWAHLAMNYWPERVREKCLSDKSLAIAHGLEDLYVEPEAKPKKTKLKKSKGKSE